MTHRLKTFIKSQFGLFTIMIFLLLFRFSMGDASKSIPDTVYGRTQQVRVVRDAIASVINPDDNVFLASQDAEIHKEIKLTGANIFSFNSQGSEKLEMLLLTWLNERCQQLQETASQGKSYFVWTDDDDGTIKSLGRTARALTFFARFEAVIPYEGAKSIAVDKILLLQPRESIVSRYCEVKRIVGKQLVMVVVNVDDFPPLIGAFELGNIIWLSSNETRALERASYQVKNYPVSLQYMMWKTNWADSWSFTYQETEAYSRATNKIETGKGLMLVDKNTSLGNVPRQFLRKCPSAQINSELFDQLCLKVWENYNISP